MTGPRPGLAATFGTPLLHTLPNGVRILAIPMPQLRSASVGVFLRVGSRDETPDSNGIGHVLEHMAFKGTTTRTVQAINLDAERLGAEVNAFTGKDMTGYFMSGLGSHAQDFLRMTADIVLNSTFPEAELKRELDVIRQEAIEYDEDPQEKSSELLDRAIWGGHPMGMPVIGTVANIERFTRDDLVRHVRAHYVAEKAVVCAAGNFDVDAFVALAAELFGEMPAGGGAAPVAQGRYVGSSEAQRFTQVSQVFVNLAWPLAPVDAGELPQQRWRLAAALASNLFGGGMSAPFVDTIRERLGLAYTADTSLESGDAWAHFLVHAVTTPDQLDRLMEATGSLLRQQAQGLDLVHLERAKNQLTVSRVRAAERTYATMERAVEDLFATGRVTPLPEALETIASISAEEVRSVFERMLRHPAALAITGKGASGKSARKLVEVLAGASR